MALSKIEKLEQQLAAAQREARKVPKPLQYTQIIPTYDPAGESLAAALAYKVTLVQAVKDVDNQLVALSNAGNVKFKAIVSRVNALIEQIPDADEKEYQNLLAQIEADESNAEMLKLTDYTFDSRFDSLKQERNAAVSALSAHLQIIETLEAVI